MLKTKNSQNCFPKLFHFERECVSYKETMIHKFRGPPGKDNLRIRSVKYPFKIFCKNGRFTARQIQPKNE